MIKTLLTHSTSTNFEVDQESLTRSNRSRVLEHEHEHRYNIRLDGDGDGDGDGEGDGAEDNDGEGALARGPDDSYCAIAQPGPVRHRRRRYTGD